MHRTAPHNSYPAPHDNCAKAKVTWPEAKGKGVESPSVHGWLRKLSPFPTKGPKKPILWLGSTWNCEASQEEEGDRRGGSVWGPAGTRLLSHPSVWNPALGGMWHSLQSQKQVGRFLFSSCGAAEAIKCIWKEEWWFLSLPTQCSVNLFWLDVEWASAGQCVEIRACASLSLMGVSKAQAGLVSYLVWLVEHLSIGCFPAQSLILK